MSQARFKSCNVGETVVSLTASASWQSAIGRELTTTDRPRAHIACLDFKQLDAVAKQSRPTVVIVEVNENNIVQCSRFAAEHLNADGLFLIGVGDWPNAELRHGLSRLGITAFYRSFLDIERLAKCVERFFENAPARTATIERRVELSLPWADSSV